MRTSSLPEIPPSPSASKTQGRLALPPRPLRSRSGTTVRGVTACAAAKVMGRPLPSPRNKNGTTTATDSLRLWCVLVWRAGTGPPPRRARSCSCRLHRRHFRWEPADERTGRCQLAPQGSPAGLARSWIAAFSPRSVFPAAATRSQTWLPMVLSAQPSLSFRLSATVKSNSF